MTATKGEHTLKFLELAFHRITAGRAKNIELSRKLSIAAVAEEAGVSTATVHNRYPESAEKVRQLLNKEDHRLKTAKWQELQAEKAKRKELTDENRKLRKKLLNWFPEMPPLKRKLIICGQLQKAVTSVLSSLMNLLVKADN